MPVISRVPLISGQIPYCSLIRGSHVPPVRKSKRPTSWKNVNAGATSEMTIPTVVRTESDRGREQQRADHRLAAARARNAQYGRCAPRCRGGGFHRSRRPARPALRAASPLVACSGRHRHDLRCLRRSRPGWRSTKSMKRLDLGTGQRLLARVHEQRARERLVGAVLDRRRARLDARAAGLLGDAHQVELVLGLLVVREAEVAGTAGRTGHALDDHVVVLGRLVVAARLALFTVDLVGEEVERPGVGARAEQLDRLVRELRIDLVVVVDLRALVPELAELVDGHAVDLHVLVRDHGDAVVGDLDLLVGDAALLAEREPPRRA